MAAAAAAAAAPPPAIAGHAWNRCISLLSHCTNPNHLRAAHAIFLTYGLHRHTFALSRLILAFSSAPSLLHHATLLFRHSPSPPNTFIYNTLIRAHARSPHPHRALHYFILLLRSSAPDHHSFPFALSACTSPSLLPAGAQIHSLVLRNGLASADHFVHTALLRLYATTSCDARKLFDEIPHRDVVHWDVLMNGYIRRELPAHALRLFDEMLQSNHAPDAHAVTTALTASAHAGDFRQGVWIHRYLEREHPSFLSDTYVGSALISMYAKCGSIGDAIGVFDGMPERNSHVWSAMVGGLAMHGLAAEAIRCLDRMVKEDGLRPDGVVLLGALTACTHAGLVEEGLRLFADAKAQYGIVPGHEHYSSIVDMLCRVGRLEDAVGVIRMIPMKPMASVWGALLTGCRTYGNLDLAELAVEELQKITAEGGDDEGVYVQLSNIYMNANKREDARRVRKLIGSRGVKKTPACSAIEMDGVVSSFVAGDQVHPQRMEICRILDCLMDHSSHPYLLTERGWALENFDSDDKSIGLQ